MQRTLVILGLLIAIVGVAWPWVSKLPLGRLPGDVIIDKPGFKFFFFPITTMIIASVVLSVILWLFRR